MYSKKCSSSRIDNNNKVPAIIDLDLCSNTGIRIYDPPERRDLFFDDNEIPEELAG